jgi:hypothetical protein
MIYGKKKNALASRESSQRLKTKLETSKTNNNDSEQRAIDLQLQNQCMGKIEESLFSFTNP